MFEQEVQGLLAKQAVFAGLEDEVVAEFARLGETQNFALGKSIFSEGDPGDAAYLIYSGKVRVVKKNEQGAKVTLGILGRGAVA